MYVSVIRRPGIIFLRHPENFLFGNLLKAFSRPQELKYKSRMAQEATTNFEHFKSKGHTAFVVGYTGEVGKALVEELGKAKVFTKVLLIGRREVPLNVGPEFEQKVVDFDKIAEHKSVFTEADVGFCCLGTTKGKSGTQGFIKVDHDYVLQAAEVAKGQGCKHFSLVSSQGADKNSSFLYPRVKGQVEEALKDLGFDRLSVYRPAFLLCERVESRPMEKVVGALLKPVTYFFPTAISIPVVNVAKAMINNAVTESSAKFELFDNRTIHHLAGATKGCDMKRSQSAPERSSPE